MGFLMGRDIQLPGLERLFFDPIVSIGYFKDTQESKIFRERLTMDFL